MPRLRIDQVQQPVILLVAEEGEEAGRIRSFLQGHRLDPISVQNREAAMNVLDRMNVDILITRLRTERIQGMALLELARHRNPELGCIFIINRDEEETATRAMRQGVVDFQMSPPNLEKLLAVITRLGERQRLVLEVSRLSQRLDRKLSFPNLIGNSGAMTRVRSRLQEIAPLDMRVMLIGEDGTGKSLVAAIIHQNSPRRNAPFVQVDCDALPARHLVRELFGTPAHGRRARRKGRLEIATDGILYLNNVDRLPSELLERIADILRTGLLRPDIATEPFEIRPRVIVSSLVDLRRLTEEGTFDEGLFQLLNETRIDMLPLRHRRRDISTSAEHFLGEFGGDEQRPPEFRRGALDRMTEYNWPGNVRELRNVVRELAGRVRADGRINEEDLPLAIRQAGPLEGMIRLPLGTSLTDVEDKLILETLKLCEHNRERTAEVLGIGVRTLYRKLNSYKDKSENQ